MNHGEILNSFSTEPKILLNICSLFVELSFCNCISYLPIISVFLTKSVFPAVWKISSITSMYKSGDTSDVRNYRQISIIPHIAKHFESLVIIGGWPKHSID